MYIDLFEVPKHTFGIKLTAPLDPIRDWIVPFMGNNFAVLHSSLLIGAVNNHSFTQSVEGRTKILQLLDETIRRIGHSLQNAQTVIKDEIMYAVTAAAVSEDCLSNYDACCTHLEGLKYMVRLRGGMQSIRKNPALYAAIIWAEVSISNNASLTLQSRHSKQANLSDELLFCQFLTRLQKVQLSKQYSPTSVESLQKESSLLAILSESDRDIDVTTNSRIRMHICQIACLFCIHFILCKVYCRVQAQAFLDRLSHLVFEHSPKKVPKASLFVFVFLFEIETYEKSNNDMDCLDWLIQLLRVVRRLQNESIQMLHQALLGVLETHEASDTGELVRNLGVVVSRVKAGQF